MSHSPARADISHGTLSCRPVLVLAKGFAVKNLAVPLRLTHYSSQSSQNIVQLSKFFLFCCWCRRSKHISLVLVGMASRRHFVNYLRLGPQPVSVGLSLSIPHRASSALSIQQLVLHQNQLVDRFANIMVKAKSNWVSLVTWKSVINYSSKRQWDPIKRSLYGATSTQSCFCLLLFERGSHSIAQDILNLLCSPTSNSW